MKAARGLEVPSETRGEVERKRSLRAEVTFAASVVFPGVPLLVWMEWMM